MPLKQYGVLKGRALAGRTEHVDDTPHYQAHVYAAGSHFRVAVNVKSSESPPELLFLVDENFQHPVTSRLLDLPLGFTELQRQPGGVALDFIRFNLFDRTQMRPMPHDLPDPDNDLNDKLDHYIGRAATRSERARVRFRRTLGTGVRADRQSLRVQARKRRA